MGGLLASGGGADVTLACADGELVEAHALVLSVRSPVFAALLDTGAPWASGAHEAPRQPVPVPPEVTSHTLRRLLHFLYTDELTPASAEEAQHLLNAADVYDVPRLFAICENALRDALTVDNAAITLTLADQHGATALKRATLAWIIPHTVEVMATDGWRHLVASRPSLTEVLLHTVATGLPPPEAAVGGDGRDESDEAERNKRRRTSAP